MLELVNIVRCLATCTNNNIKDMLIIEFLNNYEELNYKNFNAFIKDFLYIENEKNFNNLNVNYRVVLDELDDYITENE